MGKSRNTFKKMSNRFKGWDQTHVNNIHNGHRQTKTKVNKYSNERHHQLDGHKFDSKKEMNRYRQLKLLEDVKVINDLQVHVWYSLTVNDIKVCDYEADFTYYMDGMFVVEDAKGFRTAIYRLKKKLMYAIHGITIKET